MKLVGYLRVSSIGQVNDGFGLDLQRSAIETWAAANGHEIMTWCEDGAVAGTVDAELRPGFAEALAWIEDDEPEGIVAYDMTRFARDLMVQEVALSLLWKRGASVFTTATGAVLPDDRDTPTATLVRQIMGAIAQFDRANTVGRLAKGKAEAAKRGQHVNGRYPYGHHPHKPDEVSHLNFILQLHARGLTPSKIAFTLNLKQTPTRIDGSKWHCNTIKNILKRETTK